MSASLSLNEISGAIFYGLTDMGGEVFQQYLEFRRRFIDAAAGVR